MPLRTAVRVHVIHLARLQNIYVKSPCGGSVLIPLAFADVPHIKTGKAQPCDHSTHEPVVTEPRPEALEQKNDAVQGDDLSDVSAKGADFYFVFFRLGHILPC